MPSRESILAGLTEAANGGVALAIAWHVLIAAAIVGVVAGWRPSNRLASVILATPTVSVSVASWVVGNPLNGSVFAVLALMLVAFGLRGTRENVLPGSRGPLLAGAGMVAFGWVYPHFLTGAPSRYLYAAPIGLIPCPSLAAITGCALLADGFDNRSWSSTVAVAAAMYAIFGVVRLGVTLDVLLLLGAAALAFVTETRHRQRHGVSD